MKNSFLIILIILLFTSDLYSQATKDTVIEKTGWLVFTADKVIWVEADLTNNPSNKSFFSTSVYPEGLIVNYIPLARYYRSIAECYTVTSLTKYDPVTKESEYGMTDTICLLPVRVKVKPDRNPVSSILESQGFTSKWNDNEVTVTYNFEASYSVLEVELLRKSDKRKIKKVRNYVIDNPHL